MTDQSLTEARRVGIMQELASGELSDEQELHLLNLLVADERSRHGIEYPPLSADTTDHNSATIDHSHEIKEQPSMSEETTNHAAPEFDREKLIAWIRDRGGRTTVRLLSRGPASLRDPELAETALGQLVADGLGSWREVPPGPEGGRPSRQFVLNESEPAAGEAVTLSYRDVEISGTKAGATVEPGENATTTTATIDVDARPQVTRAEILAAVERLETEVASWKQAALSEPRYAWSPPRGPVAISSEIQAAVGRLVELCDTPGIEKAAWPLVLTIDAFAHDLVALVERAGSLAVDPETDPLWKSFAAIVAAKEPRPRTPVETPQQLIAQGLSERQVAKMLRWFQPNGEPDIHTLREELAEPGRHFDQADFTHARDRAYWKDLERRWQKRCDEIEARKPAEQPKPVKAKKPARESIEELLEAGINAKQIAKMKGLTIEQVFAHAARLGIRIGEERTVHMTFGDAQRAREEKRRAEIQRQLHLARLHTYPELKDQEARIAAMLHDGTLPMDVKDALQPFFPCLTVSDVVAVMEGTAAGAAS